MDSLLLTALTAAFKAGQEILCIYNDPERDFEIEQKADHSPLTLADRRANSVILEYLKNTPYPVISEENKNQSYAVRQTWPKVWIVDPLDGTKEFIKRNGEFTVNIALVEKGCPVLGVIYVPVKQTFYYALHGQGAYKAEEIFTEEALSKLEQHSIRLPLPATHTGCVVVASRSHMNPETEAYIAQLKKENEELSLTSIGSSLKICLIAEGKADVYPRFAPTMEWDTAAGHAIVLGSGRNIYETDEKTPLHYNKENLLNPWFIIK